MKTAPIYTRIITSYAMKLGILFWVFPLSISVWSELSYLVLVMDIKTPKTNILADGLTERILSFLDEIDSETVEKDEKGDW